jgi:hypothetical protein
MNYQEAKHLAQAWTTDHDINLDGWRSVIAILLQRVNMLEDNNASLTKHLHHLNQENERLSLDLGIKNRDFRGADSLMDK